MLNDLQTRYPVLQRFPEFEKAVLKGEYLVANRYLGKSDYEENDPSLRYRPLILISRKALERNLRPGPVAKLHGETLAKNIRYLIESYRPNEIIHPILPVEEGGFDEIPFDCCSYGSYRNGSIVEITDAWEWQEVTPEEKAEDERLRVFWNELHPEWAI